MVYRNVKLKTNISSDKIVYIAQSTQHEARYANEPIRER